jgi:uncharacterized protein (TIGR00375 family)
LQEYKVDLHVHVGFAENGQVVKIPAGKDLTLRGIIDYLLTSGKLDLVGIVDSACPVVIDDLTRLIEEGWGSPLSGGGILFADRLTVLLGVEVELAIGAGRAHCLAFFPHLEALRAFGARLDGLVTNRNLSTQRVRISPGDFMNLVAVCQGVLIPAHIFTPFKSIYGACHSTLKQAFGLRRADQLLAVELGLSADTALADQFSELQHYSFLTNSDAHSLGTIAREYNILSLEKPDFAELVLACQRKQGRGIVANRGLNPALGKYHRTLCRECGRIGTDACDHSRVVQGVYDYILEAKDLPLPQHPDYRPPYYHRYPLSFIPGIGPKTRKLLLAAFPSEEYILDRATADELAAVVGHRLALRIIQVRKGQFRIISGAGGIYGKLVLEDP